MSRISLSPISGGRRRLLLSPLPTTTRLTLLLQVQLLLQLLVLMSVMANGAPSPKPMTVYMTRPKQRTSPANAKVTCTISPGTSNAPCAVCPGDSQMTILQKKVERTYSKGLQNLRLYFYCEDPDMKSNSDFQFYICPRNSTRDPVYQKCLLSNPLPIVSASRTTTEYLVTVKLPEDLVCEHCLVQWVLTQVKVTSKSSLKQYIGCSDVAILDHSPDLLSAGSGMDPGDVPTTRVVTYSTQAMIQTSHLTTASTGITCEGVGLYAPVPGIKVWCETNCLAGYCPKTHCTCVRSTASPSCKAVGLHAKVPDMNAWCIRNCLAGHCPKSHCTCTTMTVQTTPTTIPTTTTTTTTIRPITTPAQTAIKQPTCKPVWAYILVPGMKQWCITNCLAGYCPKTHCTCTTVDPQTLIKATKIRATPKANIPPTTTTTTTLPTTTTTTTTLPTTTKPTTLSTTTSHLTAASGGIHCEGVGLYAPVPGIKVWCETNCLAGYCPKARCTCVNSTATSSPSCKAVGLYASVPGMNKWCITNCLAGYCPKTHCTCTTTKIAITFLTTPSPTTLRTTTTTRKASPSCGAVGIQAGVPGMNNWCITNCNRGYCPASHCKCS